MRALPGTTSSAGQAQKSAAGEKSGARGKRWPLNCWQSSWVARFDAATFIDTVLPTAGSNLVT